MNANNLNKNNINEEEKPNGLKAVEKAHKETKKDSDAFFKDDQKRVDALNKDVKPEIKPKKFDYNDEQKEYHDEMEILNGQEMIKYEEEPNDLFKDRANKALAGDSTMGNEVKTGEWNPETGEGNGNTEPVWGASDAEFGEKLIKRAKDSQKKRDDAEVPFKALGDDMEISKKKKAADMKKLSFESIMNSKPNYSHYAILKGENKIVEAWDYNSVSNYDLKSNPSVYFSHFLDNKLGESYKKSDVIIVTNKGLYERQINPELKENWYTALTETVKTPSNENTKMKRLKFNKSFNGVNNALNLIPEHYKVDGKIFQMTDGNETYTVKWEGSLSEGTSVILKGENATLISEDMAKIKHLMGYDSKKALGIPSKESRLQENYILDLNVKRLKEDTDESDRLRRISGDLPDLHGDVNSDKPLTSKWGMEEQNEEENVVEESTGKFKAQRLNFGEYAKFSSFDKANYIKESETKKIVGVEYHIVLENSSLDKNMLAKVIKESNKNKKPEGKQIKFSFYDKSGNPLNNLNDTYL